MTLTQDAVDDFRSAIIKNYKESARVFPWRKTRDAYKILVSEMMLQQTQTLRVVPKYEAWIEAFPDAPSLASAPFSDVLALWNGLGYNRRAKYLQEACREVCDFYGGKFPRERKLLESLPGIGPYTAGAVAAFAFNKAEVFIETNIRSVFIFFFFGNTNEKVSDAEILPLVERTLDKTNPREWYYALMDYGAELKKRVQNPSQKSAHYVRQSPFRGSLREARGAIVRQLTEKKSATLSEIARSEGISLSRLEKAALHLLEERFVCETKGVYRVRED